MRILILTLVFTITSLPVMAQGYPANPAIQGVDSAYLDQFYYPYNGPFVYPESMPPSPLVIKALRDRPTRNVPGATSSADAAWGRQWGPIQSMTGISVGTVKQFLADFRSLFQSDMQKVYQSTRDWGVIATDLGVADTIQETGADFIVVIGEETARMSTQADSQ